MNIDSQRKDDHVDLAEKQYNAASQSDFQKVRFVHHSFPQIKTQDVSLASHMLGHDMPLPFYINGMTGGSKKTAVINRNLAEVAK